LLVTLGVLAGGVSAGSHHSFAAQYFEDRTISIEGDLVRFEFRNPHAWVYVLVPGERGETREYGGEWSNVKRLVQQGVTKNTLKPGDRLVLTGSPARNLSEHALHVKRIERRGDGWVWGGGSRSGGREL
jgi:hypothetical protein